MLVVIRYRQIVPLTEDPKGALFTATTQTKALPCAGGFPSLPHRSVPTLPSVQCCGAGAELRITQPTTPAGGP